MSNTQKAQQILQALVQGIDPDTGEALPRDNVLNRTEVLRALLAGVSALELLEVREQRRALLPDNVGKPWTQEEEQAVISAFADKQPVSEIAARHGRTHRAIERLSLVPRLATVGVHLLRRLLPHRHRLTHNHRRQLSL